MIAGNKYKIFALLFLIPLAFDFKGQEGGVFIQYLIAFTVLAIGLFLCVKLKLKRQFALILLLSCLP